MYDAPALTISKIPMENTVLVVTCYLLLTSGQCRHSFSLNLDYPIAMLLDTPLTGQVKVSLFLTGTLYTPAPVGITLDGDIFDAYTIIGMILFLAGGVVPPG